MGDYDFTGLSPRSFEQMIQALSYKVLGPGLVIFGDGPDGGREATFSGRPSNFPSARDVWDGYVVVQAKFCQRPKGKPAQDARWVSNELKKELDSFAARGSKRKKPKYYILVTNVVLSPARDRGGKDKIADLIGKHAKRLGIMGYRVWDYDQLCRYLDADQDVRNAYRVWITPGDVLAKLASAVEKSFPEFTKVMVNFLQKELLDDHYSKLEQAGHSPENRVPLERVFVDLPTFPERQSEAPKEGEDPTKLPSGFLSAILKIGAMCLKSDEDFTSLSDPRLVQAPQHTEAGRYVLIGGPGQGKSTLAQFLSQIHRANLLRDRRGLEPDAKDAVNSIVEWSNSQGLDPVFARRFPFRIELARFAKVIANSNETKVTSVLSYIAFVIGERTDYRVSPDDLRIWLREYPWLLILDGLDEVPPSSNRTQVLEAVRDFQVDVASCHADVLILATTRPQGYNEEFSPKRYAHSWLAPLSIARALHYGTTLVELTYQHDTQRKKEVLSRLRETAKVDATVRLMESPLQITIMARLLAQIAKPPQERYKLFQQYYKVIYRREMERNVPVLSQLLRDYETDIDAIHYHTGLLLQIESERTQHTDATLSVEEFKTIVRDRLDKEGHPENVRGKLSEDIAKCATDRLVFLVPSQSERVGFEIRSLQEFMAAEALMDGRDQVVVTRIKAIAGVPLWQNVLLFTAGKCFAERQWLRDNVSEICAEMNDDPGDPLSHLVQAGSRVALALLEDGPSRRQPAYSHALARRALGLLSLPPSQIHDRLADVYEPDFETVYREEVGRFFAGDQGSKTLAPWRLLLRLATKKSIAWARKYAEDHWPNDMEKAKTVLGDVDVLEDPWVWSKYESTFFRLPPLVHPHRFVPQGIKDLEKRQIVRNKLVLQALKVEGMWWDPGQVRGQSLKLPGVGDLSFPTLTLERSREVLSSFAALESVHPYWAPLVVSAQFAENPRKEVLAVALRRLADSMQPQGTNRPHFLPVLPWPLAACINAADGPDDFRSLAERIDRGEMGDCEEWRRAEKRWQNQGITSDDVTCMDDERWPIPKEIADVGVPLGVCRFGFGIRTWKAASLKNFWELLPGAKSRACFAPWFAYVLLGEYGPFKGLRDLHAEPDMREVFRDALCALGGGISMPYSIIAGVISLWGKSPDSVALLDLLGKKLESVYRSEPEYYSRDIDSEAVDFIASAIAENSSLVGLRSLLAMIAETRRIGGVRFSLANLIEDNDPAVARDATILEMCQPEIDEIAVRRIVESIPNRWSDDARSFRRFLRVFANHVMANTAAPSALEILWEKVPDEMSDVRERIIELMMTLLGQRVTHLQEERVWRDMEFPPGLHGMLIKQ